MAPTMLCVRLPNSEFRSALELECARSRLTTRRWYQPLLPAMEGLQRNSISLETPNAIELSKTLIGLPFFVGMNKSQQDRVVAAVQSATRAVQ